MKTFKEIDIKYYDNSGNVQVRCTVPVTQEALVHYELMQSHYCKLSFKLSRPTYFLLGDFIETPYGRFELIDLTKAKDNDTIGYSYEIQFDAYYRKLKNKVLKYRPNTGSQEATFSLTSKISTHIEVIMKNLAYYAKLDKSYLYDPNFEGEGTDYTYVIDASVDANAAKLITYSNSSILDAIANIAQTFGCEWWFEGNILHFGTCENTNAITDFRLNDNIVSMSSSQSQSTYANRVYAFGAARNLPSGYKNDSDADITKDGVVEKRLMLPTSAECSEQNKQMLAENGFELKNGYIQVGGLREDQYVEGVTTNDDIYPRNLIKTSKVTSYEKDVEDESTPEEGDYIKRTFYRVNSLTIVNEDGEKTGDMAFRKAYILSGKNLHIVFQSGSLNGMDFECEFNPDGVPEILLDDDGNPIFKDGKEQINPKSQVFEIVANEDYGRFLPDTTLHPKDGDTFVLYNWNSTKLGDALVPSASNELLADAIKNLKKSVIDPTTYTCTAEDNYSYNHGRGNLHGVGDRVNLYNKGYGDGYRSSRVIGYEFSLDIPFDGAKYYVGEKPSYSRLNAMESKIEELIYNGQSYLNGNGGSGRSIYIIKSYDSITPTDYNVFSAKAVDEQRLNKTKDDTAKGTITWEKVQKLLSGLLVGNSNNENGGSWTPDAEGRSHLITDYLEVRMKAIFEELVIKKTSTIGGKEIISPAGGVVAHKVEEVTVTYNNVSQKAYRCYFLAEQEGDAVDNDFAIGDQVRSESFNVRKGTYHKVGNHFYWRLVIGRDEEPVELEGKKYHYIDLSDTDCATASDVPAKGDVLSQCGNRTDAERQNCLIFSAVDTYSPSIGLYHGINSYSFANKEYVEYGVNKKTNKAFFYVYGDMYVGDRPTKENNYEGSSYIKYDSAAKQVVIKGKFSAKSTVDGKELSQYIKENSAKGLTEEQVNNLINNSQVITDLQNQVDGAIETWFYEGVPTLKNAPASSWTTDKDKDTHLGDLYYDNKTGKAYRFAKDGSTYQWTAITDTDIAKALSDASKAQETADGKMKVFSTQPTPPYQLGDIWVNATYPSDGSTYKNEVLRCQTDKKAGSQFAIADWVKASKYTDDTVANAAKKAAEDAQKAAQTAQTNITNLDKTVTTNKKAFENYVTDGYLEPSEIAAMAQDSKRLEDDFAAAEKSYNEVKGAEVLKSTKELTALNTAFTTLSTAKTKLINYLSDISSRYNAADTNGKATIVSAVGTKFTNFQSAYSAFYDKLGLANAYITSKIYGDLGVVIGDVTSLAYLKKALMDAPDTEINGGLVLTSLIGLRDTNGNTTAGINGITEKSAKGGGIAAWFGGEMVDKDYNDGSKTPANTIFRFDGSGYVAGGAIWWGTDGRVHADPTSFIISEKNLGAYLTFFEPTWKSGSAGTSVADLVSLKPNAPFTKLGVSGDASFEGAITFHGIDITYDATNKAIKVDGNLYATGGITAYGASSVAGGGGLNASVISYARILEGSYTDADLTSIPNAYAIKALSSRIDNIATELGGLNLSWNNITGKPSTFAPSAHTHKWADITDRITKVSQLTNDSGYTKNTGTVTSVSLTLPAGLTCATKTITTSGTFAISLASGYSIPTTAKQTAWDSAYDWYALMTTDEETADGIINKWNEVVSFLANIAQTDTLSGIVDGINKSISDEVARAKKAEGVNASGISANKTSITTLQGYFTNGSAKKALQLTNARKLWGNSFNGLGDINGSIIVPSGKYISIGNIKLEYDATNKALKITNTTTNEVANLYTSGGVSAYGVGTSSSSGGGLNGSVKSYSDSLKLTSESLSEIASAYSIKALDSRISSLEGGSATSISVSGSGNAVTSVTKNGTVISVVKGSTFLTSHQSLAGYATQDWVNAKGYITSSGNITGNAATATHASSTDYIRSNGLPAPANNTVKAYKDSLVKFFKDFYPNTGIGANVIVSASIIQNWSNDSATYRPTSNYCFIKIGGAYPGTQYGQYMLSTYKLERVGIVGRNESEWTAIKWLAYTDDIPKNNNQLTNGAGYITSAGSCKYATSAGSANSVAWSNVSGRPTKVSQFTNDSGYITSSASITGNAATATKLQTARSLWGNSFNGTSDINGSIIVPSGKYISIGNIKLEYDATNKALKITNTTTNEVANLYTSGGVSAYGVGTSSSSGGGLNGSVKAYADAIRLTTENLSEVASAYSIKALDSRISSLEGGSATAISVSGSGNAVTSVTKNGTVISVVKGSTFLTSHQSLAGYATQDWVNAKGYITSSGNITGNAATATHASSTDYIRSNGLPAPANNTVKAYKDSLVKFFKDFYPNTGIGANVIVSASIIQNWSNDSATYRPTSNYCFIKIGGAYPGTQYGQYMLSTYKLERVGIVGRNESEWTAIKWLAYTDDIPKNNNQLTNGAGYITSAGSCKYATSAGSANSVAWSNVSGRPTKVSQFTNDSGYITSSASITGNAATATKLQTARSLWGNSFNGTSDINGSIIVPSGKYISIGNIKLEYDATNKALKITNTTTNEVANLYTSGGVSAYGVGTSSSSGGGLNGSVKAYADAIRLTTENLSEVASAYSIKALDSRISSLEGGSATAISVSGSGNAVTSITKNGTTISVVKGSTFLTSHQSLDGYVNNITTSGTGNAITSVTKSGKTVTFTKGATFLTSHQSLSAYLKSADAANTYSKLGHTHSYAGSSSAGGDATRALKLKDYNGDYYDIYCGYSGASLNAGEITSIVGTKTNGSNVYYKNVQKSALQVWLGLGARAYDNTSYLPLSGGTMSGIIKRSSGGLTIQGRDNAIIRQTYAPGSSSWNPIACVDTETGTWTLGHLSSGSSTDFNFCFSTDVDYNAGNNSGTFVSLRNKNGFIALTSEIPTKLSSLSNDVGYITSSGSCNYATSANEATRALKLKDYNGDYYDIYCGYSGASLNAGEITSIVGIKTNGSNVYYKDVQKSALQVWLGLGARAYDNTSYLPLSGGTMSANARISHDGGNLYLGNSDNSGWVLTQDIASKDGADKWSIYSSGGARFGDIYLYRKEDGTIDTGVIERYAGPLCLNWNSGQDVIVCNGGGTFICKTNILSKGGITAYSSSDIRLKQDLRKLDYLGIIKAMGGTFGFAWKKDNTRSIGWIAQHVLCNPHLKDIVETDENGYYKINYWSPKLIATAFGAIEQVGDEVSRLKARVVFLESEVQRLSGEQDVSNNKRLGNKNIN